MVPELGLDYGRPELLLFCPPWAVATRRFGPGTYVPPLDVLHDDLNCDYLFVSKFNQADGGVVKVVGMKPNGQFIYVYLNGAASLKASASLMAMCNMASFRCVIMSNRKLHC